MNSTSKQGVIAALGAYILWGIAPLYFKLLGELTPVEILIHRIVWSFALLLVLVWGLKRFDRIMSVLKSSKKFLAMSIAALLLSINWLLFIWAIDNNKLLEASLGYYINPLVNVLLGTLFLAERLRKPQIAAVAIAAMGVVTELVYFGSLPWLALTLACTFGLYGLVKKRLKVDAISSLCLESGVMLPVAIIYMVFIDSTSWQHFWQVDSFTLCLMLGLGVVTTVPLLCFNAAAQRISLSTLGMIQYLGPSIMFGIAILLFNETFNINKLMTFVCIWSALIVFSLDGLKHYQHQVKQAK